MQDPSVSTTRLQLGGWLAERADRICSTLERRTASLRNPILLGLGLSVLAIVQACPDYERFGPYRDTPWAAEALAWKFEHPLDAIPVQKFADRAGPDDGGIVEHLHKKSFRVTVPLLAKLTRVGLRGALVAQQVTSFLFLSLIFIMLKRITQDEIAALLGSVAIACSFTAQWGFNDFVYFDGIAYFLMLLVLFSRNAVLIPLLVVAAGFTDERAIVAAPLLYVCLAGTEQRGKGLSLLIPNAAQIVLIGGVCCFLVLRFLMARRMGIAYDISGVGLMTLKYNVLTLPLALGLVSKGSAVLLAAAAVILVAKKELRFLTMAALTVLPCLMAAMLVYDLSRSLAYAYPAVLLSYGVLADATELSTVRRLSLAAAVVSLAFPSYYILLGLHPMLPVVRLFS